MVDTITLDKTSLPLTRRVVRQGPTAIALTFANNTATGTPSW